MAIPRILRNSGLYSFVSFLQKGAAFFLLPVYTAYLTPEDYGTLSVIQALVSFFSIFLLFVVSVLLFPLSLWSLLFLLFLVLLILLQMLYCCLSVL